MSTDHQNGSRGNTNENENRQKETTQTMKKNPRVYNVYHAVYYLQPQHYRNIRHAVSNSNGNGGNKEI